MTHEIYDPLDELVMTREEADTLTRENMRRELQSFVSALPDKMRKALSAWINETVSAACAEAVKAESISLRAERDRLRAALEELERCANPETNLSDIPLLDALARARKALEEDADEK